MSDCFNNSCGELCLMLCEGAYACFGLLLSDQPFQPDQLPLLRLRGQGGKFPSDIGYLFVIVQQLALPVPVSLNPAAMSAPNDSHPYRCCQISQAVIASVRGNCRKHFGFKQR